MKIIKGGVTAPQGFKANGLSCGIKKSGKPDLALILSGTPAVSAGVFTKNSIKAAPLIISQEKLKNNKAQAIVVNSGNANCFTGSFGLLYARLTAERVAQHLGIDQDNVLVASTGIIGKMLPFKKIEKALPKLIGELGRNGNQKASRAILTTDLKPKHVAVQIALGAKKVRIGAIAKGSGMIAPDMATMLGFVATDCAINAKMLKKALEEATAQSFNSVSVDGCMSTNDMVVVMANGLAENRPITQYGRDFNMFQGALNYVCLKLAKKIVADGEGATKFITITVTGAKTISQAKKIGFAVANSNLVKTAAFGSNPNWGRVAAAVGSLGLPITERRLKISFSSFAKKNINIAVGLNLGKEKATIYTSDLSLGYVRINGSYN